MAHSLGLGSGCVRADREVSAVSTHACIPSLLTTVVTSCFRFLSCLCPCKGAWFEIGSLIDPLSPKFSSVRIFCHSKRNKTRTILVKATRSLCAGSLGLSQQGHDSFYLNARQTLAAISPVEQALARKIHNCSLRRMYKILGLFF